MLVGDFSKSSAYPLLLIGTGENVLGAFGGWRAVRGGGRRRGPWALVRSCVLAAVSWSAGSWGSVTCGAELYIWDLPRRKTCFVAWGLVPGSCDPLSVQNKGGKNGKGRDSFPLLMLVVGIDIWSLFVVPLFLFLFPFMPWMWILAAHIVQLLPLHQPPVP